MFWTRDRLAFDLETCSRVTRLVEVPAAERAARIERCPRSNLGGSTVRLDATEVRLLFEGSVLDRCLRRAALTPTQFAVIFGRACEYVRREAPHYRAAIEQRGIGRALTHPIVVDALRDEPLWVLAVAARETDPERQIEAAVRAAMQGLALREQLLRQGVQPVGGTRDEFRQFLAAETAQWSQVIRQAGITYN